MSASSGTRGTWNPLPCSGPIPKPCLNHSSVVTNKSTLMVMGGEPSSNSTLVPDLFLYKSRKWASSKRHNAPPGLASHASVSWGAKAVSFGGRSPTGLSNEMFIYNEETSSWSRARQNGDIPAPREGHSMSIVSLRMPEGVVGNVDQYAQALVVFGGVTSEGLDDGIYFMPLDTVDLRWKKLSSELLPPPSRSHHSSSVIGSKVYIFGGKNSEGVALDDMWCLDFSAETFASQKIEKTEVWPAARFHHAATSLPTHLAFAMIGGKSQDDTAADELVWVYQGHSQAWISFPLDIAPRYGHSLSTLHATKICIIGGVDIAEDASSSTSAAQQTHFNAMTRVLPLETLSRGDFADTLGVIDDSASAKASGRKRRDSVKNSQGRERKDSMRKNKNRRPEAPTVSAPAPVPEEIVVSQVPEVEPPAEKPTEAPVAVEAEIVAETSAPVPEAPTAIHEPEATPIDADPQQTNEKEQEVQTTVEVPPPAEPEPERVESPPPPPPEEPEDSIAAVVVTNGTENHTESATAAAAPEATTSAIEVKPSTPEAAPPLSPTSVASPVANFKKTHSGGRVRSSRVSLSDGVRGGWNFAAPAAISDSPAVVPNKPGNPEWIDHMDVEQLRTELKMMTGFVYSVKNVVEESSMTSDAKLTSLKLHFSDFLPQFVPPPAIKQQIQQQQQALLAQQQAQQQQQLTQAQALSASQENPAVTTSQASHALSSSQPGSSTTLISSAASTSSADSVSASSTSTTTVTGSTAASTAPIPISSSPVAIPLARAASTDHVSSSPQQPQQAMSAAALAAVSSASLIASSIVSPIPSNAGSRLTWGSGSTSPALSSSPSWRDSITMSPDHATSGPKIGHRGSMLLSLSGNSIAAALSSPPATTLGTSSPSGSGFGMSPSSSLGSISSALLDPNGAPGSMRVSKAFDSSSTAEKQAQMLEAQMEATIPTTSCPDNDQTRKERQFVVKELLETERNYVRDLKLIVDEFQEPLTTSGILNAKQVFEVFSTVKAFVPLHEQLLDNLSATIEKPDAEQSPGQIFLAMADYLKMYTQFCASQSGIAQKISDISKTNSAFRKFLDQKFKDPKCRGLTLTSFLVMPIQRVCRFPLLLKQIAKSTPVTHTDFKNLHFAIFKVDKVVMAVNEGKRSIEAQLQIYEMDQTIAWEKKPPANFVFMDPSRRFLQQESIELIASTTLKIEPMQLLLFNDVLFVARLKESSSGAPAIRKIRKAYALADTQIGLDDQLDLATSKSTLQITFGGDTINVAFQTHQKRTEIQNLLAETKAKIPDSQGVRDTITVLQNYLGTN